jgi:hypothetical protein
MQIRKPGTVRAVSCYTPRKKLSLPLSQAHGWNILSSRCVRSVRQALEDMKLAEALKIIQSAPPDSPRLEVALLCGFTPLHLETFFLAEL